MTIFIDDDRRASPSGGVGQIRFFPGFRHAIGQGYRPIRVQENWKGKAFPLHPGSGRFLVSIVDTEDLDILVEEIRIDVTVPVTVAGSVTAPRRRVEPEPDFLSPQVCQADLLAGVVHRSKIRRPITLFEHSVSPLS